MPKYYITRYALTGGIKEVEAELSKSYPTMISYADADGKYRQTAHGNDWHTTKEAAIARAEEMRTAKIKSLRKSIEKMEKLRFA